MVTALVVSVEWRLLYERCSLLGANRLRPRERLGGNYILVFLCYGASLIQYSQTHWGSLRAISKPGHFLSPLDTVAPAWFSKVLRLPQSKETHRTDFKTISGGHAKLWVFICLGLIFLMCLWASLNLVFWETSVMPAVIFALFTTNGRNAGRWWTDQSHLNTTPQ